MHGCGPWFRLRRRWRRRTPRGGAGERPRWGRARRWAAVSPRCRSGSADAGGCGSWSTRASGPRGRRSSPTRRRTRCISSRRSPSSSTSGGPGAVSRTPGWRPPTGRWSRSPGVPERGVRTCRVRTATGVATAISGSRRCAGVGAAAVWSRRSCCTGGPGGSSMWPGGWGSRCSAARTRTSPPCWPPSWPPGSPRPSAWRRCASSPSPIR